MRLQLQEHRRHTEIVTAACWTPSNELYTASDDQTICKWRMDGEFEGEVCKLDKTGLNVFVTGMFWFRPVGKQPADTFVLSCSDGTLRFMNKRGTEEKKVEASSHGAIIAVKGDAKGEALVSAAEDGSVKVWARSGRIRHTLAQTSHPVYSVCWGPDSDQVLFTCHDSLHIQSIQAGSKKLKWKAHDGVILCADWNAINNQIVSCGEDCVYKVWDSFGRQQFQSAPFETVLTSVAWSPNGETFAVGAFNMVRLCDRTGWSHCREMTRSGSVMQMDWTTDGTRLAGAGGNGTVLFGQAVGRRLQWSNVEVILVDPHKIRVLDVVDETEETLEFRDRVLEMALGFGHLVVCTTASATATQCHVYSAQNWNTPHIIDVRDPVRLIVLSTLHFLTVDTVKGVQVYTYEGHRKGAVPSGAGLRPEQLSRRTVALSSDTIAILDQSDAKAVRLYDVDTGRQAAGSIEHALEMDQISLSQSVTARGSERKLAFIDRNRDLYLTPTLLTGGRARRPQKLHAQVDTAAWSGNEASDVLLTLADGKATTYFYPNAAYIDQDLLRIATEQKDADDMGKSPEITSFFGTRAQVRRKDGSVTDLAVAPTPAMLYEFVAAGKWEQCVRLCRHVKDDALWAALAAMALHGRHLDTAEIAFAALKEVDKLHYVLYIQSIPSEEGRQAELALWRGEPDEAERTLLQAQPPLTYRAIKMNMRLHRWGRALEVALKERDRPHVATVVAYRQKYLEACGREGEPKRENTKDPVGAKFDALFQQMGRKIDWDAINAKKAQEKEAEAERAGGAAAAPATMGEEKGEGKE